MDTLLLILVLGPLAFLLLAALVIFLIARRAYDEATRALEQASRALRDRTAAVLRDQGVEPEEIEARVRQSFAGAGRRVLDLADARGIDVVEAKRVFFSHTRKLAQLLDSAIQLPLIGGVGLDALLGLIPGLGDFVSKALALVVVVNALEFGIPPRLVLRMLANIGVDYLLGLTPVLGDILTVFNRANNRNVALLQQHLDESRKLSLAEASADAGV